MEKSNMNKKITYCVLLFCLTFCVKAWPSALATPSFDESTFFRISNTTDTDILFTIEYYNEVGEFIGPEPPQPCTFLLPALASWDFNPVITDLAAEGPGAAIPNRPVTLDMATTGTAIIKWLGTPDDVTLVLIDKAAPVITLSGDNPLYITQGQPFVDPGATASDNFDGDLTSQIDVTGSVDPANIGMYELTYAVSDAAGNATTVKRTVYVQPVDGVIETISGGGTLIFDGLMVTIPPGGIDGSATLALWPISPPSSGLPPSISVVGSDRAYGLAGFEAILEGSFMTVTIGYADANQDGMVDSTTIPEEDLVVLITDDSLQFTTLQGDIDTTNNTITVEIPRSLLSFSKSLNEMSVILAAETEPEVPLELIPLLASVAAVALWRLRRRR